MGWFLTLFSHSMENNEILFMLWDFMLSMQIRLNKEDDSNMSLHSIDDKTNKTSMSERYLSLPNNSLDNSSFISNKDESKVVQGCLCEFVVAQIIVFHLKNREIDNKLSEDQLLMEIKKIDLNKYNMADYRVILDKTSKLIQLYHPENF